ncbi:hypothetical protein [Biostraticola tofi]|nr:hypothetical protein [Biostraticola tofi]
MTCALSGALAWRAIRNGTLIIPALTLKPGIAAGESGFAVHESTK